jgi:hypothetical protein
LIYLALTLNRLAVSQLEHMVLEKLDDVAEKALRDLDKISDDFDTEDWEYRVIIVMLPLTSSEIS